ncbi:Fic family protein [Knoellia subterranea]|uniref:Fido domain-containing protein n=1 Tax=Knoellia subterranea KCTC 19937 TaxID=1385521 RepID=A0A0A0JLU0_9MICO|nr:Fic family protein [Knoellia subterranea]KGN37734.1 hypothetical protein N803_11800 [Knoellia subterranea KCTC 19937]
MSSLFQAPRLDAEDLGVIADIADMRTRLASWLRTPRRWAGGLRRTTQARAIQGSNSIEGYDVSDEDAVAAVDDEEPLSADGRTWAEIVGYRRVMTYVLHMAADPAFRLDAHTLRSMHFMLLEHDLSKSPGQYRHGEIYVERDETGERVYQGPAPEEVPDLVDALTADLGTPQDVDPMVRAAMAHLNLVMIHPYRDGNGRMARVLQTLVLTQRNTPEPIFSSIEEWLGANTEDYYRVLAATGAGAWHPERDAHLWVKFCLRAHHMQAQTVERRLDEASIVGARVEELLKAHGLPERTFDPVFDAALGLRVRRPGYVKRSGVEERTATRDLKLLVDKGLLDALGNTRGRYYVAAGEVRDLATTARQRRAKLEDPYPWLMDRIRDVARANDVGPLS